MTDHRSKLVGLALAFLFAGSSISAQNKSIPEAGFVGTFSSPYSTIIIYGRGRYREAWGDCTTESYESGTYSYTHGILSLVAKERGVRNRGDKHWQSLFDPKIYREFNGDDTPRAREREFVLVEWASRLYLMEGDSLTDFVNVINFGIEPRSSNNCVWPVVGAFHLREGDEKKIVTGNPSLPENPSSMILKKPVEAEIVAIEGNGEQRIAILNQGTEAGLRPGMRLLLDGGQPKLWGGMQIISASDHTARMSLDETAEVGKKVISKFQQVKLTVTIKKQDN
jgi:hypothetical protein